MRRRIILLTLLFSTSVLSDIQQWQLWKQRDGVSVHYKKHENGIFEVQAEMMVSGVTANDFMALLSDTDSAPLWIENVTHVQVLRRLSPSETIVHSQFDSPWPVADRDMVSYSCYRRVNHTQTELMITAVTDFLEKSKGVIRITELKASWLLTETSEQGQSQLAIRHVVYADPGGAIPHWFSNKVGLKSAMHTLLALKQRLLEKTYQPNKQIIELGDCSQQSLITR
ncbi:START domain-containing protein [Pseudoalteromonas sp. ASV78]|uniref:START domain-containing protein n=1 Tax=Pseudoalteromonas sp. ASV78 TaxID=3397851 RepID=UPI0039FB9B3B